MCLRSRHLVGNVFGTRLLLKSKSWFHCVGHEGRLLSLWLVTFAQNILLYSGRTKGTKHVWEFFTVLFVLQCLLPCLNKLEMLKSRVSTSSSMSRLVSLHLWSCSWAVSAVWWGGCVLLGLAWCPAVFRWVVCVKVISTRMPSPGVSQQNTDLRTDVP